MYGWLRMLVSPSGVVLMSAQNDDALALCAGTLKDEVLAERYCNEIFAATKDMVRSRCYGVPPVNATLTSFGLVVLLGC